MKAVVFHEFGGSDVLRLEELDDPKPGPGEVALDVAACALNHLDVDVREGVSRFPVEPPHVLGLEVVGRIAELGEGVAGLGGRRPRDAVPDGHVRRRAASARPGASRCACRPASSASSHTGGYAERLVCSASQLIRVPGRDRGRGGGCAPDRVRDRLAHALHARQPARGRDGARQLGRERDRLGRRPARAHGGRLRDRERRPATRSSPARRSSAWTRASTTRSRTSPRRSCASRTAAASTSSTSTSAGELFQAGLDSLSKDGRLVICGGHSGEVVPFDIIPFFRAQKSVIGSFVYTQRRGGDLPRARPPRHRSSADRPRDAAARAGEGRDGPDGEPRVLRQDRPHAGG